MTLYFIRRNGDPRGLVKIGSASDLATRLQSLRTAVPEGIEVLAFCDGDKTDEMALHKSLAADRVAGEWFRPSPSVQSAIEIARNGDLEASPTIVEARAEFRPIPHYSTLTDETDVVEFAISCLHELVVREHRGQGDSFTSARRRVGDRIGIPQSQLKRLWDRWRTMSDVSGGMLSLLLPALAEETERDGTLPSGLRAWTPSRQAKLRERLQRDRDGDA